MGIALALCIVAYGIFLFAGIRSANRIDESIRVRMSQNPSMAEQGEYDRDPYGSERWEP